MDRDHIEKLFRKRSLDEIIQYYNEIKCCEKKSTLFKKVLYQLKDSYKKYVQLFLDERDAPDKMAYLEDVLEDMKSKRVLCKVRSNDMYRLIPLMTLGKMPQDCPHPSLYLFILECLSILLPDKLGSCIQARKSHEKSLKKKTSKTSTIPSLHTLTQLLWNYKIDFKLDLDPHYLESLQTEDQMYVLEVSSTLKRLVMLPQQNTSIAYYFFMEFINILIHSTCSATLKLQQRKKKPASCYMKIPKPDIFQYYISVLFGLEVGLLFTHSDPKKTVFYIKTFKEGAVIKAKLLA